MTQVAHNENTILSIYKEASKEAQRHKWIESQKKGRDLGETALDEWYQVHWHHYCRCKQLEHLRGKQYWQEFDEENFGQLYALILQGDQLTDRLLDRVFNGMENLSLINWALDWGLPMERVLQILTLININRSRLDPLRQQ